MLKGDEIPQHVHTDLLGDLEMPQVSAFRSLPLHDPRLGTYCRTLEKPGTSRRTHVERLGWSGPVPLGRPGAG